MLLHRASRFTFLLLLSLVSSTAACVRHVPETPLETMRIVTGEPTPVADCIYRMPMRIHVRNPEAWHLLGAEEQLLLPHVEHARNDVTVDDMAVGVDEYEPCESCTVLVYNLGFEGAMTPLYQRRHQPVAYRAIYGVRVMPGNSSGTSRVEVVTLHYSVSNRAGLSPHGFEAVPHWKLVPAGTHDQATILDAIERHLTTCLAAPVD